MFPYMYFACLVFYYFPFTRCVFSIYSITPCKCDDTLKFPVLFPLKCIHLVYNKILHNFPQIKVPTPTASLKTTARWYWRLVTKKLRVKCWECYVELASGQAFSRYFPSTLMAYLNRHDSALVYKTSWTTKTWSQGIGCDRPFDPYV
jgi:hypothetical protein